MTDRPPAGAVRVDIPLGDGLTLALYGAGTVTWTVEVLDHWFRLMKGKRFLTPYVYYGAVPSVFSSPPASAFAARYLGKPGVRLEGRWLGG